MDTVVRPGATVPTLYVVTWQRLVREHAAGIVEVERARQNSVAVGGESVR